MIVMECCGKSAGQACKLLKKLAGTTRLELATSAVTGQRSNQLNYVPSFLHSGQDDPGLAESLMAVATLAPTRLENQKG